MKYFIYTFLSVFFLFIACQGSNSSDDSASAKPKKSSEPSGPDGAKIYKTYCVTCHGVDGAMGLNGAKPIGESQLTLEERETLIKNGKNQMTAFQGILEDDQIKAVAEYSLTFK